MEGAVAVVVALVFLLAVLAVWVVIRGRATSMESGGNRYARLSEDLLMRARPCALTPSVVARVTRDYPRRDRRDVLDLLSKYGADSTLEGRERVHQAILDLSDGQKTQVRENVRLALMNFRDVLHAADGRSKQDADV
jgi:hypothetical protein